MGEGDHAARMQALVSFARGWVVTNYDNLLNLLRFFPYEPGLLNSLRNAKPADRSKLWRQFWLATDPIPETSENEALDRYSPAAINPAVPGRGRGRMAHRSRRGLHHAR
ncbi:MAG: hypothetical protein R2882_00345 [Gemmatimonadales bacterium]